VKSQQSDKPSSYVMCAATFVPERGEVWYSDGNSGFYAMKVTNGVWPFAQPTKVLGQSVTKAAAPAAPPAAASPATAAPGRLAATGSTIPVGMALALLGLGLLGRRLRRAA
jgi:hypothetical protein